MGKRTSWNECLCIFSCDRLRGLWFAIESILSGRKAWHLTLENPLSHNICAQLCKTLWLSRSSHWDKENRELASSTRFTESLKNKWSARASDLPWDQSKTTCVAQHDIYSAGLQIQKLCHCKFESITWESLEVVRRARTKIFYQVCSTKPSTDRLFWIRTDTKLLCLPSQSGQLSASLLRHELHPGTAYCTGHDWVGRRTQTKP